MSKQLQTSLELDFVVPGGNIKIHQRENSSFNEAHLEENKQKFTKQCETVLNLLKKGIRLTRKSAMNDYNIMSLERRIADLIANKIEIKKEWVTDERGRKIYVEYFI